MPEVKTFRTRSFLVWVWRFRGVGLELSVVEFVAVLKEELVCGLDAGHHTVFHHGAGAGRTR